MNPEELHNMDENQNKSWIGETVEMDFEPGLNIPEEKMNPVPEAKKMFLRKMEQEKRSCFWGSAEAVQKS